MRLPRFLAADPTEEDGEDDSEEDGAEFGLLHAVVWADTDTAKHSAEGLYRVGAD